MLQSAFRNHEGREFAGSKLHGSLLLLLLLWPFSQTRHNI